jgi:hypothetical protein
MLSDASSKPFLEIQLLLNHRFILYAL